jgi:hypothetical protein
LVAIALLGAVLSARGGALVASFHTAALVAGAAALAAGACAFALSGSSRADSG